MENWRKLTPDQLKALRRLRFHQATLIVMVVACVWLAFVFPWAILVFLIIGCWFIIRDFLKN